VDRTNPQLAWRKSTYSGNDGCVEVADLPGGGRAVRDSKNPSAGMLTFTPGEWDAFLKGARAGEFD
jgi:hypothetical protein